MNDQSLPAILDELTTGYCVSQAIYVAAELGVADRLAAGPRRADELARDLGVHERSLYRLLRALASVGIFAEDSEGRFALTPLAELLRSDVPGSQRTNIQMMVGQFYQAWGGLIESVRTGEPAFESNFTVGRFSIISPKIERSGPDLRRRHDRPERPEDAGHARRV